MVNNRITEGVGKKIVDALKKQNDVEISQTEINNDPMAEEPIMLNETMPPFEFINDIPKHTSEPTMSFENFTSEPANKPSLNTNFNTQNTEQPPIQQQIPQQNNNSFANDLEGLELPANVEILRQLINKIPSNVSKQTGAQIIKQTMEALGISMKSVLQEAQQTQEGLNATARECQNNIAEYRRQINLLESQTQKLNRQYSMLNDIISLFIQAGN